MSKIKYNPFTGELDLADDQTALNIVYDLADHPLVSLSNPSAGIGPRQYALLMPKPNERLFIGIPFNGTYCIMPCSMIPPGVTGVETFELMFMTGSDFAGEIVVPAGFVWLKEPDFKADAVYSIVIDLTVFGDDYWGMIMWSEILI